MTHPLIANDCVIAIKLPETIPAPCIVENNPPEIGPTLERPINPKIDGKNNRVILIAGMKTHFKLLTCRLNIWCKFLKLHITL